MPHFESIANRLAKVIVIVMLIGLGCLASGRVLATPCIGPWFDAGPVTFSPVSLATGESAHFYALTLLHFGGCGELSDAVSYTADIDFGDGQSFSSTIIGTNQGHLWELDHTYELAGNYVASVLLRDEVEWTTSTFDPFCNPQTSSCAESELVTLWSDTFTYSFPITVAVPEPETYAMLLAGLGLLGWRARHRNERRVS